MPTTSPNTILHGDALARLRELPDACIQCCVTSPPYFGLRDYGIDGQIGLEETPDSYIQKLVEVFREVRRVLKDNGTLWVNIGDSYSGQSGPQVDGTKQTPGSQWGAWNGKSRNPPEGLKPKDLIGIPWMLAFALRADGWYLRMDCIWHKPNCMPESVKDRPTKSHEYVFLLSKSERYFYDSEAIREPLAEATIEREKTGYKHAFANQFRGSPIDKRYPNGKVIERISPPQGRNKRSVWSIPTSPYPGSHFAVMPEALVEPCILVGSQPGDIVLDPFSGAGTVALVAAKHGRSYLGIELNAEYIQLANTRLSKALGMWQEEVAV